MELAFFEIKYVANSAPEKAAYNSQIAFTSADPLVDTTGLKIDIAITNQPVVVPVVSANFNQVGSITDLSNANGQTRLYVNNTGSTALDTSTITIPSPYIVTGTSCPASLKVYKSCFYDLAINTVKTTNSAAVIAPITIGNTSFNIKAGDPVVVNSPNPISTCKSGFSLVSGSCIASNVSQSCAANGGSGSQSSTDGGQHFGSCVLSSCSDSRYTVSGDHLSCQAIACSIQNSNLGFASAVSGNLVSGCIATECQSGYNVVGGACASALVDCSGTASNGSINANLASGVNLTGAMSLSARFVVDVNVNKCIISLCDQDYIVNAGGKSCSYSRYPISISKRMYKGGVVSSNDSALTILDKTFSGQKSVNANYGSEIRFSAVSEPGYEFDHWEGASECSGSMVPFCSINRSMPTEATPSPPGANNLIAVFRMPTKFVKVTVVGEGSVINQNDQSIVAASNQSVNMPVEDFFLNNVSYQLLEVLNPGSTQIFKGWSSNYFCNGMNPTCSFEFYPWDNSPDGAIEITANFAAPLYYHLKIATITQAAQSTVMVLNRGVDNNQNVTLTLPVDQDIMEGSNIEIHVLNSTYDLFKIIAPGLYFNNAAIGDLQFSMQSSYDINLKFLLSCPANNHRDASSELCVSNQRMCLNGLPANAISAIESFNPNLWNVDSGFWGQCLVSSCEPGYNVSADGSSCEVKMCTAENSHITYATAVSGNFISGCTLRSCQSGYRPINGVCVETPIPDCSTGGRTCATFVGSDGYYTLSKTVNSGGSYLQILAPIGLKSNEAIVKMISRGLNTIIYTADIDGTRHAYVSLDNALTVDHEILVSGYNPYFNLEAFDGSTVIFGGSDINWVPQPYQISMDMGATFSTLDLSFVPSNMWIMGFNLDGTKLTVTTLNPNTNDEIAYISNDYGVSFDVLNTPTRFSFQKVIAHNNLRIIPDAYDLNKNKRSPQISTDGGLTYNDYYPDGLTEADRLSMNYFQVNSITNKMLVQTNGGIYVSEDNGVTFNHVSGSFAFAFLF